ncbi:MAG: AAA family ATPase [Gammaproteobacteria bacterium]|nr:AAA family ATPase [Gammaproteobacteria bacterium]
MMAASLPQPVGRQREVLYLPAGGHTVVLGTAGSGKTTLAILRSLYLSDASTDHAGRTLLVTFNRCLVTYMEHLAGAIQRPIDVRNYHRFARGYLSSRGKLPPDSICAPDERLRFVGSATKEARAAGAQSTLLQRPTKFLDEEFQWIQRQGVASVEDYTDAERTGRSTRVTRADRVDLFDLFRRYLEHRARADKLYDWDDLASAVRRALGEDENARLYRHVVIDEGQDFSPEMLRSLAAAIPGNGSLTFSATSPSRSTVTGCRGAAPV